VLSLPRAVLSRARTTQLPPGFILTCLFVYLCICLFVWRSGPAESAHHVENVQPEDPPSGRGEGECDTRTCTCTIKYFFGKVRS